MFVDSGIIETDFQNQPLFSKISSEAHREAMDEINMVKEKRQDGSGTEGAPMKPETQTILPRMAPGTAERVPVRPQGVPLAPGVKDPGRP